MYYTYRGSEKHLTDFKLNILSFLYILFHFVLEHAIIILHHSNFYTYINSCFIGFQLRHYSLIMAADC